jgi:hypothetical protein
MRFAHLEIGVFAGSKAHLQSAVRTKKQTSNAQLATGRVRPTWGTSNAQSRIERARHHFTGGDCRGGARRLPLNRQKAASASAINIAPPASTLTPVAEKSTAVLPF